MDVPAIIARVDELHKDNKWREVYEYVKEYADEASDPDLLWRILRAYYRVGKHLAKDKQEQTDIAAKAESLSEKALKLCPDNFHFHKWTGILISWSSELKGTKNKIEQSFVIKEHFEKAIAINDKEPDVQHLLGRWCYEVASVSWMMRSIAKAIFATPPSSSYEEALKYFQGAEDISPDWYTGNWLYLGKTYYQLSKKQEARKYLEKLVALQPKNPEDEEYKKEAEQLIKKV